MFKHLKEWIIAKNLSSKDGDITLMGERMQIMPSNMLAGIVYFSGNSPEVAKTLYKAAEKSTHDHLVHMKESEGLGDKDLVEWGNNLLMMIGWGKGGLMMTGKPSGNETGYVSIENSSVAKEYLHHHGKSKEPVCHLARGGIAGGVNALTGKKDFEVVEVECMAMGALRCTFVCRPKKQLLEEFGKDKREGIRKQLDFD
jgi:predicted hydrocarbon binding protein